MLLSAISLSAATLHETGICVFGGTAAGVTAAVQAARMGKSVVLLEPVFMGLGQSAATVIALAIDDDCPVQAVEYVKLRAQLRVDRQVLGLSR